ncbi:unnamed protein product, partial [Ectocarpus sp. 8 AP-2014]
RGRGWCWRPPTLRSAPPSWTRSTSWCAGPACSAAAAALPREGEISSTSGCGRPWGVMLKPSTPVRTARRRRVLRREGVAPGATPRSLSLPGGNSVVTRLRVGGPLTSRPPQGSCFLWIS